MLALSASQQSAPGKSSQAIPDEQQRGGVFGGGENKGAESGQAGDSNSGAGNLGEVSRFFLLRSYNAKLFSTDPSFYGCTRNRPSTTQSTLRNPMLAASRASNQHVALAECILSHLGLWQAFRNCINEK